LTKFCGGFYGKIDAMKKWLKLTFTTDKDIDGKSQISFNYLLL
jgi:hypothetical protein